MRSDVHLLARSVRYSTVRKLATPRTCYISLRHLDLLLLEPTTGDLRCGSAGDTPFATNIPDYTSSAGRSPVMSPDNLN